MFKLLALLFLTLLVSCFAAVARYPYKEKPAEFADQEGCYLEILNLVVPYDEQYHPKDDKSCTEYFCNSSTNETQQLTCGALAIKLGCRPVADLTQEYPGCCPQEQCDETTPAPSTTEAPITTPAPSSTEASATTTAPAAVAPGQAYAYASAKSESGKPPVTETFATPGATAEASAS